MGPVDEPCGDVCFGKTLVVRREREERPRFYAYDNAAVERDGRHWRAILFARDGWEAMAHALQLHPSRAEIERDPGSWRGAVPTGFFGSAAELATFFCNRAEAPARIRAHDLTSWGTLPLVFVNEPLLEEVPRRARTPAPASVGCTAPAQGDLFGES